MVNTFLVQFFFLLFTAFSGLLAGTVDIPTATTLAASPKTLILDVRSLREYKEGHLKNALFFPIVGFRNRIEKLPSDLSTPILVYCTVGVRSLKAHNILVKKGYTHVNNMQGGIVAWQKSGNPLVVDEEGK